MPKLSIKLEKKNENSNLMDCDDNGSSNARLSEVQGDESAADGYDEDSSSFQSSQSSAYMMDGINSTITPPIPTLKPTTSGMAFRSTTPETNQQLIGGGPSTSGETINAALNDVFSSDTNLVRDEKVRKLQTSRKKLSSRKQTVMKVVKRSLYPFRSPPPLPPLTRRRAKGNGTAVSDNYIQANSTACSYIVIIIDHPTPAISTGIQSLVKQIQSFIYFSF